MKEFFEQYYPLIIVGAVLGVISVVFLLSYVFIKNKKETMGFDRNIPDKEILRRLLTYAKPYWKSFVAVLLLMVFSISYDIVAPLLIGQIQGMIKGTFELSALFWMIVLYAGILVYCHK